MSKPASLPVFSNDIDLPVIPDQLKEDGYKAGDFPEHGDINYLGWQMTKWTQYFNERVEVNGVVDKDYTVTTPTMWTEYGVEPEVDADGNLTPTITAPQFYQDLNRKIDHKITGMVSTVEPDYEYTDIEAYNAFKGDPSDDDRPELNSRLDRKISDFAEKVGLAGTSLTLTSIYGMNITTNPINSAYGNGNIAISEGWAYLFPSGIESPTKTLRFNYDGGNFRIIGSDNDWDDDNCASGISSITDRRTIHIFALSSIEGASVLKADTSITGINAVTEYATNNGIANAYVYARRIHSLLVVQVVGSGGNIYRTLPTSSVGNNYTVDAYCSPVVEGYPAGLSDVLMLITSVIAPGGITYRDLSDIFPDIDRVDGDGCVRNFLVSGKPSLEGASTAIIRGYHDSSATAFGSFTMLPFNDSQTPIATGNSAHKALSIENIGGNNIDVVSIIPTGYVDPREMRWS